MVVRWIAHEEDVEPTTIQRQLPGGGQLLRAESATLEHTRAKKHYGPKISATLKTQAPDLAAFLTKVRVDAFLEAITTYRRELMIVDEKL